MKIILVCGFMFGLFCMTSGLLWTFWGIEVWTNYPQYSRYELPMRGFALFMVHAFGITGGIVCADLLFNDLDQGH